jgi:hypothetical protein
MNSDTTQAAPDVRLRVDGEVEEDTLPTRGRRPTRS